MQIEVSMSRVMDKMAAKVGSQAAEIAQLQATNEVLTERLRDYVERDRGALPGQASQPERASESIQET